MKFKGTQGKWVSERWEEANTYYIESKEEYIAHVRNPYDAKLISKAPEMLEMLIWLVSEASPDYEQAVNELIKEIINL